MYICACNGINQRQVRVAVEAGVKRWDEVHRYYGYSPCCGMCKDEIAQTILEGKEQSDTSEV